MGKIRASIEVAPHHTRRGKSGKILVLSIGGRRDEDDHDAQRNDVER